MNFRRDRADIVTSLSEIFGKFADQAALFDEPVLAHLCRMAALEATGTVIPVQPAWGPIVAIWDWDVVHDRNHLDPDGARLFGISPEKAAKGLPNSAYLKAVHPDDVADVAQALAGALTDGVFEARYRIVTGNRIRQVFAKGYCTRDGSNRPERFPGAIMEL
jgi:PAS domain-containing protein